MRNELSDIFIINIVLQKLDKETRKNFESTSKDKEVPRLDNFLTFLDNRSVVLQSINRSVSMKKSAIKETNFPNKPKSL